MCPVLMRHYLGAKIARSGQQNKIFKDDLPEKRPTEFNITQPRIERGPSAYSFSRRSSYTDAHRVLPGGQIVFCVVKFTSALSQVVHANG
jgi:hypothetical protein